MALSSSAISCSQPPNGLFWGPSQCPSSALGVWAVNQQLWSAPADVGMGGAAGTGICPGMGE